MLGKSVNIYMKKALRSRYACTHVQFMTHTFDYGQLDSYLEENMAERNATAYTEATLQRQLKDFQQKRKLSCHLILASIMSH